MTETTKDSLGDRMKLYERTYSTILPRRSWTVVRVDGRAFHTWTRGLDRPFSSLLVAAMGTVMEALCQDMAGAVFAYAQSDEISVVLTDFARPDTQPYFDGKVQKITSVSASIATAHFNHLFGMWAREKRKLAFFDSRAFSLPDRDEVRNYLLWRQADAERNAVSMVASAHFSHKALHGKSVADRRQMLVDKGVDLSTFDERCMRGQMMVRTRRWMPGVEYTDKRGRSGVSEPGERWVWDSGPAPALDCQDGTFLDRVLPRKEGE